MRSEGFYVNEKIPMTPAGIEPATFRFVAQHLNHCATAVLFRKGVCAYLKARTAGEVQINYAARYSTFVT